MMSMQVEKPKTSRSLAATLAIAFLALSVAVVLVATGTEMYFDFQTRRAIVAGEQQLIAQDAANTVASFIQEKFSILEAAAKLGNLVSVSQEEQKRVVGNLLGLEPAFRHLVLSDSQEQELVTVSRLSQAAAGKLVGRAGSDLFAQVKQGNRYIGSVYVDEVTSEPLVIIAVPATDIFGDFRGMLIAEVNLKFMWDLVGGLEIGETGLAYVVDRQGNLIAFGDIARVLRGENVGHLKEVGEFIRNPAPVDETGANISPGINGTTIVGTYVPLGTPDWAVMTELPVKEAYREVIRGAVISVGVMLVMAILAGLVGVNVARRLAVPLLNLTETATRIAGGEMGLQATIEGSTEVASLAGAFNSMTAQLQDLIGSLEQRVADRTADLQRRAIQLQAAAEVSREAISILEVHQLLSRTVHLISERFGFYHAGVFLVDDAREYAVLRAASSEGGRHMLERGHKLRVGEVGIVGYVSAAGEPRIALDVGEDAVFFDNPDLPDTRSEMALPLMVRGRVIGALDVQSTEPAAFTEEDVIALQTMADQLAAAIENARLMERTEAQIRELSRLYGEHSTVALARLTPAEYPLGYVYDHIDVVPVEKLPAPALDLALQRGETIALTKPETPEAVLTTPLKLRDQVIGIIGLEEMDEARPWTEEEVALVEAVSDQVALALESASLFEEARSRAERLAVINRIAKTVSATFDLDDLLKAVYQEIAPAFQADSLFVALYDEETNELDFRFLMDGDIQMPSERQPLGYGLASIIVTEKRPLSIRDLEQERDLLPSTHLFGTMKPAASWLGVPLMIGERVIGVINVQAYRPHAWDEEDEQLLFTIADQVAVALENARLFQEAVHTAERLAEMDKLKTQFLANMSHELRTPLNSIIGFSRVILKGIDGPITEQQKVDLASIYNNGQHLLGLINDVLDISRIEAGKMELVFEPVDLQHIIQGVMSTAIALVKDKPIELKQEVAPDLPTIRADGTRVRQVILNLLSNAAKFTEEGQITLRAHADEKIVTISVTDTGVGISAEDQAGLFQEFSQVDGSPTRRAGGAGLGLAISRHMAEMHSGRMWMESEPGVGSTFTFNLPIAGPEAERAEGPEALADLTISPDRKLILAVEDDEGAITLYKRYLEKHGYQIVGLGEGEQAMRWARELSPYAIILDVQLPDKDGWTVLEELKNSRETRQIPLIVCTIVSDGEARGLSMGAADYLVKPILEEDLLQSLERLEERQQVMK